MRILLLLLIIPIAATADEFDWQAIGIDTSNTEFTVASRTIAVKTGALCDPAGNCDISAQYSVDGGDAIEFIRVIANMKPTLRQVRQGIEITMTYFPFRHDHGLKEIFYYEWNQSALKLELKNSSTVKIEID